MPRSSSRAVWGSCLWRHREIRGSCIQIGDGLKHRNVLAYRNGDVDRMGRAFRCVVLAEALAQAVGLNPHDRIGILVKGIATVKDVQSYGIFLDLGAFAGECLLAQVR